MKKVKLFFNKLISRGRVENSLCERNSQRINAVSGVHSLRILRTLFNFQHATGQKQDADIYKKVFSLTWPAFIELFLSSLFGAVDMIMVGKLGEELGPIAISAVGITIQPFYLLIAVFAAVNVGTTTLVAWNMGAGRKGRAINVARQAIMFNIIAGSIMSIAGVLFAPLIMGFVGKEPVVIGYATQYLQIVCAGLVFQAVNMGITAAFRGCGQTRIPMLYNVGSNGINVVLNYLLIYGKLGFPQYGVAGAAIATTASRMIATFVALYFVFVWKYSPIKMSVKDKWKLSVKDIKEIFIIGVPAAGEQIVRISGLILYTKMLASLGVIAYAAHQIAAGANEMVFSVSQAFQVSTTTLVGQATGADDYKSAESYTLVTRRMSRIVTAFIAVILIIFAKNICSIYTTNIEVINTAAPVFIFVALVQFMQSSQMSTAGALRGAGDTMYPLYATLFGIWIFRIGAAAIFIFVFGLGLRSAWFAFFLDQCLRNFMISRRFKGGKWKTMKAVKLQKAEELNKRMEHLNG